MTVGSVPHLFSNVVDAAAALHAGRLIVHPTEGLYGLGADANQDAALDALDSLKDRKPDQGYVLIAADLAACDGWIAADPAVATLLAHNWAAPLTIVCAAGPLAPRRVCHSEGTVALRIDRHPATMALGALLMRPWVSTSVNLGGQAPALDLAEMAAEVAQAIAGVYDLEPRPRGSASTLVRIAAGQAQLLRAGELGLADIQAVLDGAR